MSKTPSNDRVSNDRGAATLIWIACVCVLFVLALVAVALAEFTYARSKADAAADLAALAGAKVVLTGQPCAEARSIAKSNGARLKSCEVAGTDVVVAVEQPVGRLVQHLAGLANQPVPRLQSTARAGQPE